MKQVAEEFKATGIAASEEKVREVAELRVRDEIKRGVQMIQYQVITLMTTNGQAPFVTVFMYIDEVPEGQTREDLALVIEEVLKQRIQGVKNEKGVWITPAFPKLIYVLEEDNIREDSKYWNLTKLAAECTAKRMVPDYISEKIMKNLRLIRMVMDIASHAWAVVRSLLHIMILRQESLSTMADLTRVL